MPQAGAEDGSPCCAADVARQSGRLHGVRPAEAAGHVQRVAGDHLLPQRRLEREASGDGHLSIVFVARRLRPLRGHRATGPVLPGERQVLGQEGLAPPHARRVQGARDGHREEAPALAAGVRCRWRLSARRRRCRPRSSLSRSRSASRDAVGAARGAEESGSAGPRPQEHSSVRTAGLDQPADPRGHGQALAGQRQQPRGAAGRAARRRRPGPERHAEERRPQGLLRRDAPAPAGPVRGERHRHQGGDRDLLQGGSRRRGGAQDPVHVVQGDRDKAPWRGADHGCRDLRGLASAARGAGLGAA
mmetsp:Transcript_6208/g.18622  ORF Transcript_6208/g.18622 Transcript_6208/m.18622 type:complete len:303 (+) Transcript_6208:843-1751(+)